MNKRVLIVGGGFSGALCAVHLLRSTGLWVLLAEPRTLLGKGPSFSPPSDDMVLNVPADRMGAFAHNQEGFEQWLSTRPVPPAVVDDVFVSRSTYGEYLQTTLLEELSKHEKSGRFVHVRKEVVSARIFKRTILADLSTGDTVSADTLVLACGTLPRAQQTSGPMIFGDPWFDKRWISAAEEATIDSNPALIIGTGLTAVDVATYLLRRTSRPVVMISRRGLLPLSHAPTPRSAVAPDLKTGSLRSLMKQVRSAARDAENWCDLMESIRPIGTELWKGLELTDRRRFIRHVSSYWNAHRHRIPPSVRAELDAARVSGRLSVLAGRVTSLDYRNGAVEAGYVPRGSTQSVLERVSFSINCTGPAENPESAESELFRSLLDQKLIASDPTGIGLLMQASYRAQSNGPVPIYTIGHWLRGDRWESSAVRELRVQAAELAAQISADLEPSKAWQSS